MSARPTGVGPFDLLTLEELARYLRVRESTASAWAEAAGIACPEAPGAARYLVTDIAAALRGHPVEAEPAPPRRRPSSPPPRVRL